MTEQPEQPRTWPVASICKCGLAKSYHEGRFQQDHEYDPRWNCPNPSAHEAQAAAPEQDEAVRHGIDAWYATDHPGLDEDEWRSGLAHSIIAALASPPPVPAALDVERLERIGNRHIMDVFGDGLSDGRWQAIAAEYARLSHQSEDA